MNRQHRFRRIATAQRVAEVSRMFEEYERELLRESARGIEELAAPPARQRRRR